jgi:DNA-binding beta-propeller fold protein YncE
VFVADTGNERLQEFSSSGTFIRSFGTRGTAAGQFDEPSSVAVDARGNVYVADFWNQRIQVFSPSGTYGRSWPVTDWSPQSYDEPYLAVDNARGRILASDPQQQQVLAYSLKGQLLGKISSPQLTMPIGVAVLPGDVVAVTDPDANIAALFRAHERASKTRR